MSKRKGIILKRIKVEKLFGLYDYEIPAEKIDEIEKILILYGDNGSGKTTVLRLIFHLLACEKKEGHKTFASQTKFKKFVMEFSNGYQITAIRKDKSLLGTFEMLLYDQQKLLDRTEFIADQENTIPSTGPMQLENDRFLDSLAKLNLTLYLLADDRTVRISSPVEVYKHRFMRHTTTERIYDISTFSERDFQLDPEQISIRLLVDSLRRLQGWIRNRAMISSRKGESDVNEIFSKIIENIAIKSQRVRRKKATTREYLLNRITKIEQRNKKFSKFGLTPIFNTKKFIDSIDKASPNKFRNITPIIVPYLDSVEAKLDALNKIQERIETFVININSFILSKTISFRTGRGFTIKAEGGEELMPDMLSSGERHLLLLFCNTIMATDTQSIFIIDEPEISLNVKWQRNLITSLQNCTVGSQVQFIFASHSLEILSQHMEKVVKLETSIKANANS